MKGIKSNLRKNYKKIIGIMFFVILIGSAFVGNINTLYANVNENYSSNEQVGEFDVSGAVEDSILLEAIAYFVYALAGFIEWIVGVLVGYATGSEIFPWADRIIFNTIPFLDVNFLSPASGSLFKDATGNTVFGDIIQKIYYTIFSISIAFFGVCVGVMAIRLAISSIASEKAKYKQALTSWLFALILIFIAHYLMSFIFFVNEKMVEIASAIVKNTVIDNKDIKLDMSTASFSEAESEAIAMNLFYSAFVAGIGTDELYTPVSIKFDDEYPPKYAMLAQFYMFEDADDCNSTLGLEGEQAVTNDGFMTYTAITSITIEGTREEWIFGWENFKDFKKIFFQYVTALCMNEEYMNDKGIIDYKAWRATQEEYADETVEKLKDGKIIQGVIRIVPTVADKIAEGATLLGDSFFEDGKSEQAAKAIINDALAMALTDSRVVNVFNSVAGTDFSVDSIEKAKEYTHMFTGTNHMSHSAAKVWASNNALGNAKNDIFTNLGKFFKNLVYGVKYNENGKIVGFTESQFNPIPAILYAIFVLQSVMYFIAYIKRFFYIIVIALFAPLVIIYDFFSKVSM